MCHYRVYAQCYVKMLSLRFFGKRPRRPQKTRENRLLKPENRPRLVKHGLVQFGCVLEADISPVTPGANHLVISLINVIPGDAGSTWHATKATEYHILVRHPNGSFVPMNEQAHKETAIDKRCDHGGNNCGEGNGNGVVIPLAQWFDMSAQGDYTVLVSLPIRSVWVAKPLKVKGTRQSDTALPRLIADPYDRLRPGL
jgi:hypothetical protein